MSDRQKQIPTTPKQLLLEAADVLRQKGHAKRHLLATDGGVCAMGAMFFALGVGDKIRPIHGFTDKDHKAFYHTEAEHLLMNTLNTLAESIPCNLAKWNDMHERKGQDVIDLFEKTALEIKE